MVGAELMGGLAAFKSLYDAAKSIKDMSDATVRNAAVIDLQSKILEAQAKMGGLIDECKDLESQLAQLRNWEAEKARYALVSLGPNIVAYAEKADLVDKMAPHYLCANCFAAGTKSFLQQILTGEFVDQYKCSRCSEGLTIQKNSGRHRSVTHTSSFGREDWMR